jgi:hypothetical protein
LRDPVVVADRGESRAVAQAHPPDVPPAERYGAGRGTDSRTSSRPPRPGAAACATPADVAAKRARFKEALLAADEFTPAYVEGIVEDVFV